MKMLDTETKNKVLESLKILVLQHSDDILKANQKDLELYNGDDISMLDRLKMSQKKIDGLAMAIDEIIAQPDPVGRILYESIQPNGLEIKNVAVPFGKILIIYESRPDVTIEAAITAFKAGNIIFLKGGKESLHSNKYLTNLWHLALTENNLPVSWVKYLDINREATQIFIKENNEKLDLIIPRGGDALIKFVQQNAAAPVLISGRGNNFLLVSDDADWEMAESIIVNGKSRVSVCNALDKVIFLKSHKNISDKLESLVAVLQKNNIEILGTPEAHSINNKITLVANDDVLKEEFLAPKIMFLFAENMQEAIKIINENGGGHSSVIVSQNIDEASQFMQAVDSAAVYHNASTRFTDGGAFGLGAEMAISTQKLHARGPVSLAHLVSNKWFVFGSGQIRE